MSSTLDFSTLSLTDLLQQRSMIDAEIFKQTGGTVTVTGKKARGQKKVSARSGKSTVYGDFSSKIQKEHAEEIKAFKEANPDMKGYHMTWVGNYKKEHADEYTAFKTAWDLEHPKADVSETSSVASATEGADGSVSKPKKVLTPEHLAALKAGREAKKAKKDAEKASVEAEARSDAPIAPVVAPVAPVAAVAPVEVETKKKVIKTAKKVAA